MCDNLLACMTYVNVYLTINVCLYKAAQNMSAMRENGGNEDADTFITNNKITFRLLQHTIQQFQNGIYCVFCWSDSTVILELSAHNWANKKILGHLKYRYLITGIKVKVT